MKDSLIFFVSFQNDQFTSQNYVSILIAHGVRVSMDGRGRFLDNIFVERLWRSLKYEEVYLNAYATITEARRSIEAYFHFYNNERPHEALGYKTPNEVFSRNARPDGFVKNSKEFPTTPQAPQQLQNDLQKYEKGIWLRGAHLILH